MNSKATIFIVLVTALATTVCSASGGSDENMPYIQLLRELRKKGTGMRRTFNQDVSAISKREENCNALYAPCSQYTCALYTCEDVQLACNTATSPPQCEPGDSSSYRR